MQIYNVKLGKVALFVSHTLMGSTILMASMAANASDTSPTFMDRVKISGYITQGAQMIEADIGAFDVSDTDMGFGYNRVRFALDFSIQITDNISAYVDLGEEPNDFGLDFKPAVDLAFVDIALNDTLSVRMGTIITWLFNYRGFSDDTAVQSNSLIGNSPADFVSAAEGLTLLGNQGDFTWDVSMSSSAYSESFDKNRGFTYIGRARYKMNDQLSIGMGASVSNHGDQVTKGGITSGAVTAAYFSGDGENYRFNSAGTGAIRNTHVGIIPGLEATAILIDAQYEIDNGMFRAWYSQAQDDFSFGDASGNATVANHNVAYIMQESKMNFFGIEATYYVIPDKFYIAGRYVSVTNNSEKVTSEDNLNRLQVGVGYKYSKNVLFKVEYIKQEEEANSGGQIGSDWDGIGLEASYTF